MRTSISTKRPMMVFVTLHLMTLASVAFAQDSVSSEQVVTGLAFRLWIVILSAIIAWLSRGLLLRRLNKLMKSESKKAAEFSVEESVNREVVAHQELNLIEVNAQSDLSVSTPRSGNLLKQAKKAVNSVFVTNLIIAAGYLVISLVYLEFEVYQFTNSVNESNMDFVVSSIKQIYFYKILVITFLVWNIMRFLGERNQLSAYGSGPLGILKSVLSFIFKLFHGFWCQAIGVVIMVYTLFFALIYEGLFATAVLFHLFLWYRIKRNGRKRTNVKLLILRVFFIKKTSVFTFTRLVKSWRHLGTYFTVADPSFYKLTWKQRFNYFFPFYIIAVFLIYTVLTDSNKDIESQIFASFMFLLITGNIISVIKGGVKIKQNFMVGQTDLNKRLKKLERSPTNFGGTFKESPVMCYENNWKIAVDGLINSADVILMDLRGFSEANKGCAYEVNVLFDNVPANRIVFVGYADTAGLIRTVIKEQWAELSETSPNLNIKDPYTTLYTVSSEDTKDVQRVLSLLLESTASESAAGGA